MNTTLAYTSDRVAKNDTLDPMIADDEFFIIVNRTKKHLVNSKWKKLDARIENDPVS